MGIFAEFLPEFRIGIKYLTRGGWPALIIWRSAVHNKLWAIHRPGKPDESHAVLHDESGKAVSLFEVGLRPVYGPHPADLTTTIWQEREQSYHGPDEAEGYGSWPDLERREEGGNEEDNKTEGETVP